MGFNNLSSQSLPLFEVFFARIRALVEECFG